MNGKLFMLSLYKKYGKDIVDSAVNLLCDDDKTLLNEGRIDILTPFINKGLYGNYRILKGMC